MFSYMNTNILSVRKILMVSLLLACSGDIAYAAKAKFIGFWVTPQTKDGCKVSARVKMLVSPLKTQTNGQFKYRAPNGTTKNLAIAAQWANTECKKVMLESKCEGYEAVVEFKAQLDLTGQRNGEVLFELYKPVSAKKTGYKVPDCVKPVAPIQTRELKRFQVTPKSK